MTRSALDLYLREVRRHPLLSREEEAQLAQAYAKSKDPQLAGRLVIAHLRLVVSIAREYCRSGRGLLDLIQEGNLGLLQAVQRYEPHRGVPLAGYAEWWIRGYMLRHLLQNARLVQIGQGGAQQALFFNLRKVQKRLEAQGVVTTSNRYLAEVLNVPERAVDEMQQRLGGDGEHGLSDALEAAEERPDARAEAENFKGRLRDKLSAFEATLTGRDRVLFRDRLFTESPALLREVGVRLGMSDERARQIEEKLRARLRAFLEQELGDALAA